MNEQHKETLSALFDGESNDFETRRLLQELESEDYARWQRFQLIRDSVTNRVADCNLQVSVAESVAAAIADEPAIHVPANAGAVKAGQPWLRPLMGFATAASIGFFSIMGILQFNQVAAPGSDGFVANGNVSASQLPISANVGGGLNTVSGSVPTSSLQREIEAIDAQKQRDRERLKVYLQQHAQHASFNNGRGLMPMARMAEEEN